MVKRIDSDEDARRAYHRPATAARHTRLADLLTDIENRARRRDRRRAFGFTAGRVHDLVSFFTFTYGSAMPDEDAGRDDFFIFAQHVAGLNGDPVRNIVRYADRWCPWMGDDELAALVRRVLARPYRWRGDTLGEKIGLIDAVRTKWHWFFMLPRGRLVRRSFIYVCGLR